MTHTTRLSLVDAVAPPERLAAFRILVGGFSTAYLLTRVPVYLGLSDRADADFDGVGVLSPLSAPLPEPLLVAMVAATVAAGVAFTLGALFRAAAPVFAIGLLVLSTYRSSFGQLLHFENLFVLHALILVFSPAADAWAVRLRRRGGPGTRPSTPSTSYGFPLALASLVTVITYVLAGVAKLRYGGIDWVAGDALRNHIAYSAARSDLIGGTPATLAATLVDHDWLLRPMAAATVLIELGAPLALLGPRWRWSWAGLAWVMHMGILGAMLIGFPYPLFGVAFAPLFHLEQLRHPWAAVWRSSVTPGLRCGAGPGKDDRHRSSPPLRQVRRDEAPPQPHAAERRARSGRVSDSHASTAALVGLDAPPPAADAALPGAVLGRP